MMAKKDSKKADKAESGDGGAGGSEPRGTGTANPKPPAAVNVPAPSGGSGAAARVDVATPTPTTALTEPGGDAAETARRSSPGSSAPVTVDTPTSVEVMTTPAGRGVPAPGAPVSPQRARPSDLVDGVGDVLLTPLRLAGRVLPTSRTSVVFGVAALTVVGALDWPVAVAAGLGYEALRRWTAADDRSRRR
jgi:hypothetical protein